MAPVAIPEPYSLEMLGLPTSARLVIPNFGQWITVTFDVGDNATTTCEGIWFEEARRTLEHLKSLQANWDSYGAEPPNSVALFLAEGVLHVLRKLKLKPGRIVPSAEGGLAITFRRGKKYADIEFFNSGEILAIVSNGESDPVVWEVGSDESNQALKRIQSLLGE